MKEFKCEYCNYNRYIIVVYKNNIRFDCYGVDKKIVECKSCGLVQLFPKWEQEELNGLYEKYHQKLDFKGYKPKKNINKYLEKYFNKENDILEIGSGLGDNVKYFRKKGYNVIGIEKDECAKTYNCEHRDFFNWFPTYKFDIIYAMHVLEHMNNPYQFLERILSLLSENGKFILEFPTIEDPLYSIYKVKNYKKFFFYPYHTFFYDEHTIRNILGKAIKNVFPTFKYTLIRKQRYGMINHVKWIVFGKPGNINWHIPVIDRIYKWFFTNVLRKSDTMILIGEKQ